MRCRAGGRFNANGNVEQHLQDQTEIKLFLNKKSGNSSLRESFCVFIYSLLLHNTDELVFNDKQFTWVK